MLKNLNPNQVAQIHSAVERAEAQTSAELVPVIVANSDSYWDISLLLAMIFCLFATLIFSIFQLQMAPSQWSISSAYLWLLVVNIFSLSFGAFLGTRDFVLEKIIPKARRNRAVATSAAARFMREGIATTKSRTGLLIYVSLLEQKVLLVGDIAFAKNYSAEEWLKLEQEMEQKIFSEDIAAGLATAILSLGSQFQNKLPVHADDTNELGDGPRLG